MEPFERGHVIHRAGFHFQRVQFLCLHPERVGDGCYCNPRFEQFGYLLLAGQRHRQRWNKFMVDNLELYHLWR